jgi:RNA 2',3'-cyclic 3'-phosphodiesterase
MPRLFVAIRPPDAVIDHVIAIKGAIDGARWQDEDQLHLTVRYVGDVDAPTANDVAEALNDVRAQLFAIGLNGVGTFQHKRRIDTLWVGVTPRDALTALHKKIDHALVRLGLPPEGRAYRPHVTIARFGRNAGPITDFVARHGGFSSAAFVVDRFMLYESHLSSAGSAYEIVARYALD